MALIDQLLILTQEMEVILASSGEVALGAQIRGLEVVSCSYDVGANAGYIRVESARKLNVVEVNIIESRYERTVSVEHPCRIYLDVDNFGRITGIELLNPTIYSTFLAEYRAS